MVEFLARSANPIESLRDKLDHQRPARSRAGLSTHQALPNLSKLLTALEQRASEQSPSIVAVG